MTAAGFKIVTQDDGKKAFQYQIFLKPESMLNAAITQLILLNDQLTPSDMASEPASFSVPDGSFSGSSGGLYVNLNKIENDDLIEALVLLVSNERETAKTAARILLKIMRNLTSNFRVEQSHHVDFSNKVIISVIDLFFLSRAPILKGHS